MCKAQLVCSQISQTFICFSGVFILDLEATNMTEVVYRIVEELNIDGAIEGGVH